MHPREDWGCEMTRLRATLEVPGGCPAKDARLVPCVGTPAFESQELHSEPRPSAGNAPKLTARRPCVAGGLLPGGPRAAGCSLQRGAPAFGPLACVLVSKGVSALADSCRRLYWGPPEPPRHRLKSPAPHHHTKPDDDSCLGGEGASCDLILPRPPAPGGHVRRPPACTEPRRHPRPGKAGLLRPRVPASWRQWLLRGMLPPSLSGA